MNSHLTKQCGLKETNSKFSNIAKHHIESFDYISDRGLDEVSIHLQPAMIPKSVDPTALSEVTFSLDAFEISKPQKITNSFMSGSQDTKLYPWECRMMTISYNASLNADLVVSYPGEEEQRLKFKVSSIPIMVGSKNCNLFVDKSKLILNREDQYEHGGYFIINGNSRLIRMTINPRRNYPCAYIRGSFSRKEKGFSNYGVQIKCVRSDECSQTVTFHYVNDGNIKCRIVVNKRERLIPLVVIIKALQDVTDFDIFYLLTYNYKKNKSFQDKSELILLQGMELNVNNRKDALELLGQITRGASLVDSAFSDVEAGEWFVKKYLFIHVNNNLDKLMCLINCVQKLYLLVDDLIKPDNSDALTNQEVLLSGHLYMNYLRECIEDALNMTKARMIKECRELKNFDKLRNPHYIRDTMEKSCKSIGKKIDYLISTGNIKSRTGLDLLQASGYSIVADKLNPYRFLSHFRAVHRGSYFTEMKTTEVRKLLPEQFGFVCPVHTPDGSPCGLLNHITQSCDIIAIPILEYHLIAKKLKKLFKVLNMVGIYQSVTDTKNQYVSISLDGRVLGYIQEELANTFCEMIRSLKCEDITASELGILEKYMGIIPKDLEIVYVPFKNDKSYFFGGIYMFSCPARLTRAVQDTKLNKKVKIGPLEQQFLEISLFYSNHENRFKELSETNFLSILASLTPLSNHNQSPRNMYQCQMLKQSMTHMNHNYFYRFDSKSYRLYFPQLPLVRTENYEDYDLDEYPSGTNAVVAVMSYTGYDMEDAMIINKSSYERGFGYGCVYKTTDYHFNGLDQKVKNNFSKYDNTNPLMRAQMKTTPQFEADGVLPINTKLSAKDKVLCIYNEKDKKLEYTKWKENESSYVEQVLLYPGNGSSEFSYKVKYRIPRNPIIGDKFSSRHGQKGVLGFLWPHTNMPFSECGISPDILINPHAFPSRMTIGMLIESIAGKQAALRGEVAIGSTFQANASESPYNQVDYFGSRLKDKGFYYYGNEYLYSGITGDLMKADIFMGLVYYQRLRHMISDKAQARSTGLVDPMTQQPLKGRKRGGGIRIGEMERDSLISHGVSFCLQDRLMLSSDASDAVVCEQCCSMLSAFSNNVNGKEIMWCQVCKNSTKCRYIRIPYTLRLLQVELLAMNVNMNFKLKKNWDSGTDASESNIIPNNIMNDNDEIIKKENTDKKNKIQTKTKNENSTMNDE